MWSQFRNAPIKVSPFVRNPNESLSNLNTLIYLIWSKICIKLSKKEMSHLGAFFSPWIVSDKFEIFWLLKILLQCWWSDYFTSVCSASCVAQPWIIECEHVQRCESHLPMSRARGNTICPTSIQVSKVMVHLDFSLCELRCFLVLLFGVHTQKATLNPERLMFVYKSHYQGRPAKLHYIIGLSSVWKLFFS